MEEGSKVFQAVLASPPIEHAAPSINDIRLTVRQVELIQTAVRAVVAQGEYAVEGGQCQYTVWSTKGNCGHNIHCAVGMLIKPELRKGLPTNTGVGVHLTHFVTSSEEGHKRTQLCDALRGSDVPLDAGTLRVLYSLQRAHDTAASIRDAVPSVKEMAKHARIIANSTAGNRGDHHLETAYASLVAAVLEAM